MLQLEHAKLSKKKRRVERKHKHLPKALGEALILQSGPKRLRVTCQQKDKGPHFLWEEIYSVG